MEHAVEHSMLWNKACCGIKRASFSRVRAAFGGGPLKKYLERVLWNKGYVEYGFCGIKNALE